MKNLTSSVKRGVFLIGTQNAITGEVSFAREPKQHTSKQAACAEVERLVREGTVTKTLIVAEIVAVAKPIGVSWV